LKFRNSNVKFTRCKIT